MSTIKFPSKANASSPIDGIQCNSAEQSIFHIHSHLSIFINGQNYTIPSLIGITNSCFYWMHTHDKTGIIHIEVPVNKNFSLGQFFDMWKTKFNNNQIFNNTVNNTHQLMVYVNSCVKGMLCFSVK